MTDIAARPEGLPAFAEVQSNFAFLDDWEDRYRYLIELGRAMGPFADADRTAANKVQGCASQVWMTTQRVADAAGQPKLIVRGDSDALIVRGLVALLVSLASGHAPREVAAMDIQEKLSGLGLGQHLTPQRSNGLASMIKRLKAEAAAAA
jgi:cysteine desulfuration protein SufE